MKMRPHAWRDGTLVLLMFVFALFGVLSAGYHHFPLPLAILYVVVLGTLPVPIYSIIAHMAGWQKVSASELVGFWLDLIFWTWP